MYKKSYLKKLKSRKAIAARNLRTRERSAATASKSDANEVIEKNGEIVRTTDNLDVIENDSDVHTKQRKSAPQAQSQPAVSQKMEIRRYQKVRPVENDSHDGELLRRFDTKNFVKIKQSILDFIDRKTELLVYEPTDVIASNDADEGQPSGSESSDDDNARQSNSKARRCAVKLISRKQTRKRQRDETDENEEDELNELSDVDNEELEELDEPDPDWKELPRRPKVLRRQKTCVDKSNSPPRKKCSLKITNNSFPKMADIDMRCARYGWIKQDISDMPIVFKGDLSYPIPPPEDYVFYNDKKLWAGKYTMCIGQKNLCQWM